MEGNRVGGGYIEIGADASKVDSDLARQMPSAGTKGGGILSNAMGVALGIGLTKVAAQASKVLSIGFSEGFKRLTSIDNAQAKLKGLGHSAEEVTTIMDNALASVKGTAFGLGDAASLAATMVATGIKPGEDLTRTLKLMADTATISGTSLGDMGNVFGKVAASGKVTGESIGQLTDRGIPVLQMLGDSLGVTAEEAGKMASKGKISFEQFQQAMEKGLGGAAAASGDTFTGAMANVKAALGRIGAKVEGPMFKQMPEFFKKLSDIIDTMGPSMEKFGGILGNALSKGLTWLLELVPKVQALADRFSGPGGLATGIAALAGPLGIVAKMVTGNPLFLMVGLLVSLVSAFAAGKTGGDMFNQMITDFGAKVTGAMTLLPALFESIVSALPSAVNSIMAMMTTVLPSVISTLTTVIPPMLTQLVSFLANGLIAILPLLAQGLSTIISALADLLVTMVPIILNAAVDLFMSLVTAIVKVLPKLIESVVSVVDRVMELLPTLIPTLINAAVSLFLALVDGLIKVVPMLLQGIVTVVTTIGAMLPTLLPVIIDAAIKLFTSLITAVTTILPVLLEAVVTLIMALVNMLPTLIPLILDAAVQLMMAVVLALPQIQTALLTAATALIQALSEALPVLIPVLQSASMTLMAAIAQALVDNKPALIAGMNMVIDAIIKLLPTLIPLLMTAAKLLFDGMVTQTGLMTELMKGAVRVLIGLAIAVISEKFEEMKAKARELIQNLINGVGEKIEDVKTKIGEVITGITDKIGDVTGTLAQKGRDLIQGLLNGLTGSGDPNSPWSKLTTWVSGIAGWIKDHKGPLGLDSEILKPAGTALMNGLSSGLMTGFESVKQNVSGMLDNIVGAVRGGGSLDNLIAFGKKIQGMGFSVTENPYFGGVHAGHASTAQGGKHYIGQAIDINKGAGTSKAEQAALASILDLAHSYGLKTLFMTEDHLNHMHAQMDQGGWLMPGWTSVYNGTGQRELVTPMHDLLSGMNGLGKTWNAAGGAPSSTVSNTYQFSITEQSDPIGTAQAVQRRLAMLGAI